LNEYKPPVEEPINPFFQSCFEQNIALIVQLSQAVTKKIDDFIRQNSHDPNQLKSFLESLKLIHQTLMESYLLELENRSAQNAPFLCVDT
jgi:hypothetical protein